MKGKVKDAVIIFLVAWSTMLSVGLFLAKKNLHQKETVLYTANARITYLEIDIDQLEEEKEWLVNLSGTSLDAYLAVTEVVWLCAEGDTLSCELIDDYIIASDFILSNVIDAMPKSLYDEFDWQDTTTMDTNDA